jgi:hypothetical protein
MYRSTYSCPHRYLEVSGHAPGALPLKKSPWYPLDGTLGGPQNLSGKRGEEKNIARTEFGIWNPRQSSL